MNIVLPDIFYAITAICFKMVETRSINGKCLFYMFL